MHLEAYLVVSCFGFVVTLLIVFSFRFCVELMTLITWVSLLSLLYGMGVLVLLRGKFI